MNPVLPARSALAAKLEEFAVRPFHGASHDTDLDPNGRLYESIGGTRHSSSTQNISDRNIFKKLAKTFKVSTPISLKAPYSLNLP
ncbi:hypothetical protein RRG08_065673 [Elysia crispata]|uniref:Uncharacterized protein n=1 Tax=Elysia crispata TaxID=231223 RepID=A0AAE1AUF2_9GAST|nr:hypothetical protein RRG08_065673 [Elysia crispata]